MPQALTGQAWVVPAPVRHCQRFCTARMDRAGQLNSCASRRRQAWTMLKHRAVSSIRRPPAGISNSGGLLLIAFFRQRWRAQFNIAAVTFRRAVAWQSTGSSADPPSPGPASSTVAPGSQMHRTRPTAPRYCGSRSGHQTSRHFWARILAQPPRACRRARHRSAPRTSSGGARSSTTISRLPRRHDEFSQGGNDIGGEIALPSRHRHPASASCPHQGWWLMPD